MCYKKRERNGGRKRKKKGRNVLKESKKTVGKKSNYKGEIYVLQ